MARRKIDKKAATAVAKAAGLDDDGDGLPDLTAQQLDFVQGILAGKNASDAYRQAYDCSNSAPASIWRDASVLRSHPKVSQWISAARKAHLGSAVVTLESHSRELERLKEIAVDSGNVGAAVQAEQLRGKAHGLYVERYENVTPADPLKSLKALAEVSPDIARILAARFGLKVAPLRSADVVDVAALPIKQQQTTPDGETD